MGATEWSTSAIASSEVKIPWPIAVPNEVVSPLSAVSSLPVSVVGGTSTAAVPANVTSPTRGPPPCDLMNSAAARSAAVIRLGGTSVEHIEPRRPGPA